MDFLTTFLIAIGLAMDVFAVSLGIGTLQCNHSARFLFRLSFHFGLFQGGMTFLGWLAGSTVASLIASFDHWIAAGFLAFVAVRMIRSGFDHESTTYDCDPSRGSMLIILSVATSIDALAVGISFAILTVNIATSSLTIGIVSTILSLVGLRAGHRLGMKFGKRMEILGGLILLFIGARILITHLFLS
ncbi:MAG: manganese efflux pump [Anaerolineales bacterium]|nr:manganese efflux pump [Anaerolineales bacterium]